MAGDITRHSKNLRLQLKTSSSQADTSIEGQTGQNYLHVFLFARLISATQKTVTFAQSLQTALKKPAVYSPHLGKPDSTKERGVQIYYLGFGRFGPSYTAAPETDWTNFDSNRAFHP